MTGRHARLAALGLERFAAPIGYTRSGHPIFPIAGGDGTNGGGDGAGDGGADNGEGGDGSGDGGSGQQTGSGPNGTFTQADIDRIAAQTRAEAKRAAIKDIAAQLGMSPADAKKVLEAKAAADEAAKTEEQKRADELAERERKADERERATAERERSAAVREALAEAGATGQELKDAAVLITAGLDSDADDEAITKAVDDLKKRRAELFKGTTAGSTGTGTHGAGGSGTGSGGGNAGNGGGGANAASKLAEGAAKARELGLVREQQKTA